MPQLTKGAGEVLAYADGEITDAVARLTIAKERAIANPRYCQDQVQLAINELIRLQRELPDRLRPFLERQAPQYEQRLTELERRLEALESSKVIPIRQERKEA